MQTDANRLIELTGLAIEQPVRVGTPSGEGTLAGYFSPLDVLEALNEADTHLTLHMLDARKEDYRGKQVDVEFTSGLPYVALQNRMSRVKDVQIISAPGVPFAIYAPVKRIAVRAYDLSQTIPGTGTGYAWTLYGDQLWITGPYGATAFQGTARVYYADEIDELICAKMADNGTTTTIVLPTTRDDTEAQYFHDTDEGSYVGHPVAVLYADGTRAKTQVMEFSDHTMTVSPTIVAPAIGDRIALIPRLPRAVHKILPVYASVVLRGVKDEAWEHLDQRYSRLLDMAKSVFEERTDEMQSVQAYGGE